MGGLLIKFLKNRSKSLVKLTMKHPYFTMFTVFASFGLLIFTHLARKFGRRLKWYNRLIIIILSLLVIWLLNVVIKAEAFKTILDWLKSIIIQIIVGLRSFTSLIDSYTEDLVEKPKPSTSEDFKVFVFFSLLTAITTRYLLYLFYRKLVGPGPFTDEIIKIIEMDVSAYLPKIRRNS